MTVDRRDGMAVELRLVTAAFSTLPIPARVALDELAAHAEEAEVVALLGHISFVRGDVPLVGEPIPVVRIVVTLVGQPVAFVGDPIAFVGGGVA
jgi:hypothetical protein